MEFLTKQPSAKTSLEWALLRILNQISKDLILAKSMQQSMAAAGYTINSGHVQDLAEVLAELQSEQELR